MNKIVIELQNIKRNFQVGDETVHALRGVSFSIREGEFVTIMGTSGSGKSTLLNTLGCLDTPTSGEYLLDGVSVRTMSKPQRAILRNRKIGFVFQNYNLLPKTTAVENVELPLMYNSSVSAAERRRRAIDALRAVLSRRRLRIWHLTVCKQCLKQSFTGLICTALRDHTIRKCILYGMPMIL